MNINLQSLERHIDWFSDLPCLIVNEFYKNICYDDRKEFICGDRERIINYIKVEYKVLAYRLNLVIKHNRNEDLKFAFDVENQFQKQEDFIEYLNSNYIKSRSTFLLYQYQKIIEVWKLCEAYNHSIIHSFDSPEDWWYEIEWDYAHAKFSNLAVFGEKSKILGKRKFKETVKRECFDKYFPEGRRNSEKILSEDRGHECNYNADESLDTMAYNLLKELESRPSEIRILNSVCEEYNGQWKTIHNSLVKEPKVKGIEFDGDKNEMKVVGKHRRIDPKFKLVLDSGS